jgi:hypothetical protein
MEDERMNQQTDRSTSGGRSRRGVRRRIFAVAAVAMTLAFVGSACAPPSPDAGPGGIDINFGPLTIPLPPIEIRPPATKIPLGLCDATYQAPGVRIVGATVTIPGIRVDPNQPIITVPNVRVNIPQLRIPTSTVGLTCPLVPIPVVVQVDLIVPSSVHVRAATLNLTQRTITLANPTFTVLGAGLGVPLLGDLIVPLPPIVNVPLPTSAIKF